MKPQLFSGTIAQIYVATKVLSPEKPVKIANNTK